MLQMGVSHTWKKTNSGPINICSPGGQPAEAGPILRQAIETVADGATWFHGVFNGFSPTAIHEGAYRTNKKINQITLEWNKGGHTSSWLPARRPAHAFQQPRPQQRFWPRKLRQWWNSMAKPSPRVPCSRLGWIWRMQLGPTVTPPKHYRGIIFD